MLALTIDTVHVQLSDGLEKWKKDELELCLNTQSCALVVALVFP